MGAFVREEEVAGLSDPGPLLLNGLFRKDYRSLSKERNWSLRTFPDLISQQDFQSIRLSIKDYLEQIAKQGIVHELRQFDEECLRCTKSRGYWN